MTSDVRHFRFCFIARIIVMGYLPRMHMMFGHLKRADGRTAHVGAGRTLSGLSAGLRVLPALCGPTSDGWRGRPAADQPPPKRLRLARGVHPAPTSPPEFFVLFHHTTAWASSPSSFIAHHSSFPLFCLLLRVSAAPREIFFRRSA